MAKSTTKKRSSPDWKKVWTTIGLAAVIIVFFLGVFLNSQTGPGRAIYIGQTPWNGGSVDLSQEGSLTFTSLPDETGIQLPVVTEVQSYDPDAQEYTVLLSKKQDALYALTISKNIENIIIDTLEPGEIISLHLNTNDALPDLSVSYLNGTITFKNIHYVQPDTAFITLLDGTTTPPTTLPAVIRINPDATFTTTIKAQSSSAPTDIISNIGTVSEVIPNIVSKYTTATLTFTAPNTPAPVSLDLTATVQDQDTHAYYTLAVGDAVYSLRELTVPNITLTLASGMNAQAEFNFSPSRELQPLAFPCIGSVTSLNTLFETSVIEKVYGYDAQTVQTRIWTQGTAPDDLPPLSLFRGYFVKLKSLASTEQPSFTMSCIVKNIKPATAAPPGFTGTIQSEPLYAGWNLISLPGTVPRPLTEFTTTSSFTLYQCSQNYQCTSVPVTTALAPGKPYWVYTSNPITIRYILE